MNLFTRIKQWLCPKPVETPKPEWKPPTEAEIQRLTRECEVYYIRNNPGSRIADLFIEKHQREDKYRNYSA